jgi:mono/diheme cytochrome c family protein
VTRALVVLIAGGLACAQNVPDAIRRGETVFNKSCATGYCHGAKGAPGGAPRLAARGFDQAYIDAVVTNGIKGTAMPSFSSNLPPADVAAVVAYVATLNGIANPAVAAGSANGAAPPPQRFTGQAARGRALFSDSVRGFSRCSTCHEAGGLGIAVATPIAKVPADAVALKALATPEVSTATIGGESMPALMVAKKSESVIFYDLTAPAPVLRTVDPASVQIREGSAWRHSSAIGAYDDAELSAILTFLRAAVK